MTTFDTELEKIATDWQFEKCPRCLEPLRRLVNDRGAGSHDPLAPDSVSICSKCGNDEAIRQHETGEIIPMSSWPILNGAWDYTQELHE